MSSVLEKIFFADGEWAVRGFLRKKYLFITDCQKMGSLYNVTFSNKLY